MSLLNQGGTTERPSSLARLTFVASKGEVFFNPWPDWAIRALEPLAALAPAVSKLLSCVPQGRKMFAASGTVVSNSLAVPGECQNRFSITLTRGLRGCQIQKGK